ncbi:MAG: hypothetical protein K2J81_07600 [Treponemataceae bacterium]|nr:hypothetical protein [Treponemataceae bacterium]
MNRLAVLVSGAAFKDGFPQNLLLFKEFLKSDAGGSWTEREILVTEQMSPPLAARLAEQLAAYDFSLVYTCNPTGTTEDDYTERLRNRASLFIRDTCAKLVPLEAAGYETAESQP